MNLMEAESGVLRELERDRIVKKVAKSRDYVSRRVPVLIRLVWNSDPFPLIPCSYSVKCKW